LLYILIVGGGKSRRVCTLYIVHNTVHCTVRINKEDLGLSKAKMDRKEIFAQKMKII